MILIIDVSLSLSLPLPLCDVNKNISGQKKKKALKERGGLERKGRWETTISTQNREKGKLKQVPRLQVSYRLRPI